MRHDHFARIEVQNTLIVALLDKAEVSGLTIRELHTKMNGCEELKYRRIPIGSLLARIAALDEAEIIVDTGIKRVTDTSSLGSVIVLPEHFVSDDWLRVARLRTKVKKQRKELVKHLAALRPQAQAALLDLWKRDIRDSALNQFGEDFVS